jgi:hypothetical protein
MAREEPPDVWATHEALAALAGNEPAPRALLREMLGRLLGLLAAAGLVALAGRRGLARYRVG